jgi:hypothetical protein
MKSVLIFTLALILLVPLARTVLAAPAVDRPSVQTTRVLLKGTIQSNESYTTVSPTLYVTANGSGESTALGPFTVSYHTEVNLVDFSEAETAHFTGSNGDSLEAKAVGQSIEDQTPDIYNAIEIYTITGGTGRFAGASGTFTLKRLVSRTVGAASSTFEGYVLVPLH